MSGIGALGKIIAKGGGDAIRKILPKTSRDYYDQFDPQTYYHATMEDINIFDPNKMNPMAEFDEKPRNATYFSSSPKYVNEYLDEYFDFSFPNEYDFGAQIYPVKIKTKDLFDYKNEAHRGKLKNQLAKDFSEENKSDNIYGYDNVMDVFNDAKDGYWFALEDKNIQDTLKKLGFSGYKSNEPGTVGLFNSDKGDVRSLYAKFDPKQAKSGEILATVTPYATVGTIGALAGLDEGT